MKANKLEDGLVSFRQALKLLMLNAAASRAEADEALEAVRQVGDYILAMSLELERRGMLGTTAADLSALSSDEEKKRVLELSAYFTVPARLEPQHRTLALFSAMNFAQKSKQWGSALGFANRVIEEGTNAKFRENVSFARVSLWSLALSFLTTSSAACTDTQPLQRPNVSRPPPSARGPQTPSRSTSTPSRSSPSAPQATPPSTPATLPSSVPSMAPSTSPSTRAPCVKCVRCVRWAAEGVG